MGEGQGCGIPRWVHAHVLGGIPVGTSSSTVPAEAENSTTWLWGCDLVFTTAHARQWWKACSRSLYPWKWGGGMGLPNQSVITRDLPLWRLWFDPSSQGFPSPPAEGLVGPA